MVLRSNAVTYIFQQESVSNLRKAQSLYMTRQQEYEKAKDVAQKAESDALSTSVSNTNLVAKIDKSSVLLNVVNSFKLHFPARICQQSTQSPVTIYDTTARV